MEPKFFVQFPPNSVFYHQTWKALVACKFPWKGLRNHTRMWPVSRVWMRIVGSDPLPKEEHRTCCVGAIAIFITSFAREAKSSLPLLPWLQREGYLFGRLVVVCLLHQSVHHCTGGRVHLQDERKLGVVFHKQLKTEMALQPTRTHLGNFPTKLFSGSKN